MTDAKKKVAANIERAKADLDLALADLDKLPDIDSQTFSYCAHALNNYLMVAGAATELLGVSLAGHPDDQVRIWVEGLRHAINLMTHSVRRMMNESNGHEPELKFEKVDSALLIFRVCNFYQRKAEWKKIQINCEAEPDLPLAWMDRVAFAAVMDNLLSNALKFSERGKSVWVRARAEGAHLVYTVQDEGPGLSEQDKPRLFQKGVRLSSSPTAGELSTGYGLALAKELTEKMDGTIWCESQAGHGASFFLRLKAVK